MMLACNSAPDHEELAVKSLKISLLATLPQPPPGFFVSRKRFGLPIPGRRLLLAFVGCVLLQVAWTNAKKEPS